MKKLLIGFVAAILLIVAAALVVPYFIPLDTYETKIVALVKTETGRDLRIDGPVRLSLLPRVALAADNVALSNPPGSSVSNMVQLKTLDVALRLFPLLHGAIEIEEFKLVDPVIDLEIDKAGRPNWAFSPPASAGAAGAHTATAPESATSPGGPPALSFGDVSIVNGTASYLDQRTGEKRLVSGINLEMSLPDFAGPFGAKGGATWNAEPVALTASVARPDALLSGRASSLALSLASHPVNFDFQGEATGATLAKLAGTISLSTPSVRNLATWAGVAFDVPGTGFGAAQIDGKIAIAGPKIAFTEATLALDAIKGTGALTLDMQGPRPHLTGRLDIDKLDVNPYLPPPTQQSGASPAPAGTNPPAASAGGTATAEKASGWSDAPIDLASLKSADADFDLAANSILYRKIAIGKSDLALHLKDGRFEADLKDMALYQGKGEGQAIVDGSEATPAIAARFNLDGIAIQPLLRDAAGFGSVTGVGGFVLDVTGHGKSQREIVSSLAGKGNLGLANGKIEGVNLVAFMKNLAEAVTGGQSANETDFSALTGTFVISNGILHNDDLKLVSPELPMTGAGTVDLPQRHVDYRLSPSVAGIIAVPITITGPWDDLSYRPDLSAMGKNLIQQPGKALDLLKDQGSGAKDLLKGLLGK